MLSVTEKGQSAFEDGDTRLQSRRWKSYLSLSLPKTEKPVNAKNI